jgi:hypothetical protein
MKAGMKATLGCHGRIYSGHPGQEGTGSMIEMPGTSPGMTEKNVQGCIEHTPRSLACRTGRNKIGEMF